MTTHYRAARLLSFLLLLLSALCWPFTSEAQTKIDPSQIRGGTYTGNGIHTGTEMFANINNVIFADQQAGATADVKISNCLAALPAGGGTCDARGLVGAQTWAANPFAGNKANVVVQFNPSATFTASNVTTIGAPNVWLMLNGATIDFEPTCPCTPFVNDRAVAFQGSFVTSPGSRINRPVTGTIALKATSFTATNANDASDVNPGDWLQVYQTDPGVGDAVASDWVQVLSVTGGTTINIVGVFRTAFIDNTTDSILFNRITNPIVENGGIVGGTIKNTNAALGSGTPGIEAGISRNITIRDNVVQIPIGQPLYAYQSSMANFINNRVKETASNAFGSEFSKSNDMTIIGNHFQAETSTATAGVLLDFGLGHFTFTNNTVNPGSVGIAMELQTGLHDGVVSNNIISLFPGSGTSIGGLGAHNVIFTGNRLETASGGAAVGINLVGSSGLTLPIASVGNVVVGNKVTGFTTDYLTNSASDLIIKDDGSGNFSVNHISRASQVLSDQGNVCTNGELALSAGWQSTGSATVTAVAGNGQTCSWTITTGTTTAANPTITDTLTNAPPAATTVCWMNIYGGTHTAVAGESLRQTTLSATAPVFTANFTPTNTGATYFVTRGCGP